MLHVSLFLASFVPGQTPPPVPLPEPIRLEARSLKIPFAFPPELKEVKGAALFVSQDDGKTWKLSSTISAEKSPSTFKLFGGGDKNPGEIEFVAPNDGLYSFSTQVLMKDGRKSPADGEKLPVQLRVLIDTAKKGK